MIKPTVLLAVLLAIPVLATAAPKKRANLLQPLEDEMTAKGELPKLMMKALKNGDRCIYDDKRWEQATHDGVSISDLYEMLQGAVFCWQDTEKKASKAGEGNQPAADYFRARARHIEAYRSYIWAMEAKGTNNRLLTCKRLKVAVEEVTAAITSADGLAEKFTSESGQALAAFATAQGDSLSAMITDEYSNQKCD